MTEASSWVLNVVVALIGLVGVGLSVCLPARWAHDRERRERRRAKRDDAIRRAEACLDELSSLLDKLLFAQRHSGVIGAALRAGQQRSAGFGQWLAKTYSQEKIDQIRNPAAVDSEGMPTVYNV